MGSVIAEEGDPVAEMVAALRLIRFRFALSPMRMAHLLAALAADLLAERSEHLSTLMSVDDVWGEWTKRGFVVHVGERTYVAPERIEDAGDRTLMGEVAGAEWSVVK